MAKTYNNLYSEIISLKNIILAWRKARKHKTKKLYVIEFEKNLRENLLKLHEELKSQTYMPKPLKTFILHDPKTRKISKSAFRDRIIHHALIIVIEPIFEKRFIYDSCANRKGRGNLFALKRFYEFARKISKSAFRDRIVHHALCSIIEPIFNKAFIYDSCANRIGQGNLFALNRFYRFIREVSKNGKTNG